MITITTDAANRIKDLLAEENDPNIRLRMFVQGGGCSGFSYGFSFDDTQNEDDFIISAGDTTVLVDSMSLQYVQGATVDFKDDLNGARFAITNPQATTTCGCGSSFSV